MASKYRTQLEANKTWSAYYGTGFRKGGFHTQSDAQTWIDQQEDLQREAEQHLAWAGENAPPTTDDPVGDAVAIMRRQAGELLEARMQLVRARSLLRQANVYTKMAGDRWVAQGLPSTPASDVRADIEKFLEETGL